ncbi:MAG TPA: DUF4215 domain-containing protein [Kofleriaceae bacterium]|nr:DUF4215 domain-containing protein [Kofleriaceae bacterium]
MCAAPACGDGVRQGNEACDDGNHTNGDGCDDGTGGNCRPSGCGNGVRGGSEECDDGNSTQGDGCDNNCTTTACGNGVITSGEVCDDDGTAAGDGCSTMCQVEAGFTCSMVPSVCVGMCGDGVRVGAEMCDDAPPAENGDGCSITCVQEPGYTCTGSPSVCATSCGDGVRAGSEGCDDPAPAESGDGCNASCFVEPGWVCVGTPSLCFPICGDGRAVPTEACDDPAPAENGDGCSSTCTVETGFMCSGSPSVCVPRCGDGLRLAGEACDDAPPAESGDGCSMTCTIELGWTCTGSMPSTCSTTCGDGIRAGTEQCDDLAPNENGDGCSATCTVESGYTCTGTMPSTCATVCGDGLVRPGEGCDDGRNDDLDGCSAACQVEVGYVCAGEPSTCAITCGDGDLDIGEACDDGRNDNGDGCSAACQVELGFDCGTSAPSVCTSTCGDGIKASNEACDDAAPAEDNDGCSATCTLEPGYGCTGTSPTICAPTCGDNTVVAGEPCDDPAPAESGDGCSATCTVEAGWYCSNSPSACTTQCGDGIPAGTEQCDDMNTVLLDGCALGCRREPTEIEPNEDGTPQTGASGIAGNDFDNAGGVAVTNANNNAALLPIDVSQGPVNILGAIALAGDEDVFQIRNSSATQPYSVRIDVWNRAAGFGVGAPCPVAAGFDTGLTIRTATGTSVTSNDDRNSTADRCSGLTLTVLQGQTFYIHLVEFGDDATLPGYGLQIVPTQLTCPNGVPNAGEECDDGNINDTDACRNNCTLVDGCGDGNIDGTEQCDDDNVTSGDGCSSTCQLELTCGAGETPVIVTDLTSQAIADDNLFHDYPAAVATTGGVTKALVFLRTVTHATPTHLDIQLASPGGGVIRNLSDDNGTSANYVQTLFDDAATSTITSGSAPFRGRFRPEQSLSTTAFTDFRGMSAAGTWNLQVRDDTSGTTGTLDGWALGLCINPTTPFCGDTVVGAGEECDDGNTSNTDACSSQCQLVDGCGDGNIDGTEACDDNNVVSADGCSATCAVEITCGANETPVVVTSTASTAIPDDQVFHDYSLTMPTSGAIRRVVVAIASITHPANGQLDLQLRSPGGIVRDLSSDNGAGANLVQTVFDDAASSSITSGASPFTGRFRPEQSLSTTAPVDFRNLNGAGSWTLQIADDTAGMAGTLNTFTIAMCVDTTAAYCGDTVIGAGEECDDGNASNADACSSTCQLTDGCGDGNIDAGETCDDDNFVGGDGCSATCNLELTCGAGEVPVLVTNSTPGPITDNQMSNSFPVTVPVTGAVRRAIVMVAGITHANTLHLDIVLASPSAVVRNLSDDNGGGANYRQTLFDDTASSTIASAASPFTGRFRPEASLSTTRTTDFNSTRADGVWDLRITDDTAGTAGSFDQWTLGLCVLPGPYCGNGTVDTDEECDDGNTNNGDSCSNACAIADGCGDGNLDAGEQCDDNNATSGDGCSATCQVDISCGPGETPLVLTNSTATPIPDGTSGIASGILAPIDVAVAGVVRKVITSFDITHPFDGDVDIFLSSPFGVQRDLSTDQTGVNYRRTVLSDAGATSITSGTAPYTGTFRPEQTISNAAGFANQSAAGRWVLRVSDDAGGDTGTLNGWTLALCIDPLATSVCGNGYIEASETCDDGNAVASDGCSATCQLELTCAVGTPVITRSSVVTPLFIPDSNTTGVSMPIAVSTAGTVRNVVVVLGAVSHQNDDHLDLSLVPPASAAIDLSSDNGASGDDYVSTVLDDTAPTVVSSGTAPFRGRFRPETALVGANNQAATGAWNLKAVDDSSGEAGVLHSWVLGLCVE